jgi:hypothetical protein
VSEHENGSGDHVRYVMIREGSVAAEIPAEVAHAIEAACEEAEERERSLDLAALVLVRLGNEGGRHLLGHWMTHDPTLLRNADPALAEVLAHTPEVLTGPLRA